MMNNVNKNNPFVIMMRSKDDMLQRERKFATISVMLVLFSFICIIVSALVATWINTYIRYGICISSGIFMLTTVVLYVDLIKSTDITDVDRVMLGNEFVVADVNNEQILDIICAIESGIGRCSTFRACITASAIISAILLLIASMVGTIMNFIS